MAFSLSDHDLARLAALQETLLSPLDHNSVHDWCVAVLRHTEALFQGDRSAMLVPLTGGELHYVSESIDPGMAARFREVLAPPDPGALRFTSAPEDSAWGARRAQRLEIWNIPMLAKLTGRRLEVLPAYHDYILPSGIIYGPVATTALPAGESFLGVADAQDKDARFNGAAGLNLMRLVLPAFKAGVKTIAHLETARAAFVRVVDELSQALLVTDLAGHPIHESAQLRRMLAEDCEGTLVRGSMRRMAEAVGRWRTAGRARRLAEDHAVREVRTRTARYDMRASLAGPAVWAAGEVILVALDRLDLVLPTTAQLMDRHQLTRREADVVLLLTQGFSNKQIAEHLGMSRHTVRHHAESVFLKLGVHTRKALALLLLDASLGPPRAG